jgi:uncharacterized circularly permuted ATP-grasp superfamily protein
MFQNYQIEDFFDEMFTGANGSVFNHYRNLVARFEDLSLEELEKKQHRVNQGFLEQGITFTVYGDEEGTERIFPFDLIPRIIPEAEWHLIERGLTQRIIALNLFLNDIYHEEKIIKDGIIPENIVKTAVHYRPEMVGLDVPKDIYIHICGSDLIRDSNGDYLVLEDNARCPSGVSYLLENREASFPRALP